MSGSKWNPFLEYAEERLRLEPLMPVAELEQLVAKKYGNQLDTRKVGGRNRKRWENLVDWVKATLTMRRAIEYVQIGEVRYILYLRPMATLTVAGCKEMASRQLVDRTEARRLVQLLLDRLPRVASKHVDDTGVSAFVQRVRSMRAPTEQENQRRRRRAK